jgi:hypothetical protein
MVISATDVLKRANELYKNAKLDKWGESVAAWAPEIRSDQVKAAITAVVEAINKELSHDIEVAIAEELPS